MATTSTPAFCDELFHITFDDFLPGATYTTESGPPADFSFISRVNDASSIIESSHLGLTNKPLVAQSGGGRSQTWYLMDMIGITNHIISLTLDLSASSEIDENGMYSPQILIGFDSRASWVIDSTVIIVHLGKVPNTTNGLVIYTLSGNRHASEEVIHYSGVFTRNAPIRLFMEVNTYTRHFSVSMNDEPLVTLAPYSGVMALEYAVISSLFTDSEEGSCAFDNITLNSIIAPESMTAIDNFTIINGFPVVRYTNAPFNKQVLIQRSDNIKPATWTTLTNAIQGSNYWADESVPVDWNILYYRLAE